MASVLYNIIIRPLELFFQFVYGVAYGLIGNYGFSIILLSLAIENNAEFDNVWLVEGDYRYCIDLIRHKLLVRE